MHTSTSETYGSAQFVPITEDHPQVGQSPYAASKIAADQIALSYWRSFGTPVTVLRPFNLMVHVRVLGQLYPPLFLN